MEAIQSEILSPSNIEWPSDVLVQFLHALSVQCDSGARRAWQQLAFLTCKRDALAHVARTMPLPILLRIDISSLSPEEQAANQLLAFKIPFMQATVVRVDVDWGDGCVDRLPQRGEGFVQHVYAAPGEYRVRVFPTSETSLDHLGFAPL
jgi:hypothetical protein